MLKHFRIIALALMLSMLFATSSMVFAQEATSEATVEAESAAIVSEGEIADATPTGAGTFMLFLGGGAIILVGVLMIARDNFRGDVE